MGNHICCLTVGNIKEIIQLVQSDGTVQTLHKPLSVAQIVEEFPEYLICHSGSLYIGRNLVFKIEHVTAFQISFGTSQK